MTNHSDKPKRWRPKFSIRALVIGITVLCCYAACWSPTKDQGVKDVARHVDRGVAKSGKQPIPPAEMLDGTWCVSAEMPLLVGSNRRDGLSGRRQYCFWFFGCVVKLPFENEIKAGESRTDPSR